MMQNIYVNPKIKPNKDNIDNWFVEAVDYLKEGELVLIESVFVSNHETVHNVIEGNERLFNSLYPRTQKWSSENIALLTDLIVQKVMYNTFNENDDCILAPSTSYFNHDCKPNCVPIFKRINNIPFMLIFAVKNIDKGDQLTISYSEHVNHKGEDYFKKFHDFECNCERNKQQRTKIKDVCYKVGEFFFKREEQNINDIINKVTGIQVKNIAK